MKPWFYGLLVLVAFSVKAVESPYESVRATTDSLLERLLEVQPLYASDPEKFYLEIDKSLAPFVDFSGFSRGVMAKYYGLASEQQKILFAESFRTSLVRTYAKALVEFDNKEVVVRTSDRVQKNPLKARVSLEIHAKDGAIYPVEYSLVLIDGQWKLRNLVVSGINLGLQFRSQFAAYMQQYKGNMDDVIAHWDINV